MSEKYSSYKQCVDDVAFSLIIGKYDHILGPVSLYSSNTIESENFIRDLLRDALNTTNKYIFLEHDKFYSQVCKIDIDDPSARGGKQSYALIFLRDAQLPVISVLIFQQIEKLFKEIGFDRILADDNESFKDFSDDIYSMFVNKQFLMPLESLNIKIRSEISTILGFCDIIIEQKTNGSISEEDLMNYLKLMRDSALDIKNVLNNMFTPEGEVK